MNFLADKIGEEYKKWKNGDLIIINAPTGRGKTTFITEKFLPYSSEQGKKILYLVNRKILREQIQIEIENNVNKFLTKPGLLTKITSDVIWVCTYQEIENWILQGRESILHQFDVVVYDEAHYFYADSNFNTKTQLSFDCLWEWFTCKLQIFMSATIDNVKNFILDKKSFDQWGVNHWVITKHYFEYTLDKDYSFVDWKYFTSQTEMKKVIGAEREKEKWLIFVDSKENGKQLYEDLKKIGKSVNYIDAEYWKDENETECVQKITTKKRFTESILIATAVMDNGISLIDEKLRNIVIMADIEETFLQMLGRKREDNQRVTLYLFQRNAEYFQKRLNTVQSILKLEEPYLNEILAPYRFKNVQYSPYKLKFQGVWQLDCRFQQHILNDVILGNSRKREEASKLLYSYGGVLAVNMFSLIKYKNLRVIYNNLINELRNDENAFIKMQARWLGFSEEQILGKIESTNKELDLIHVNEINNYLEKAYESPNYIELKAEDNKTMKKQLKDELVYFAKKGKLDKTDITSLTKFDRPIQSGLFNELMKIANLPYKMSKASQKVFVIQKTEK